MNCTNHLFSRFTIAIILAVLLNGGTFAQSILYVDSAATGSQTGNSWKNAMTDLQQALNAALPGQQVWVAKGTYHPTLDTGETTRATLDSTVFTIANDSIEVYGGFSGNETRLDQRDWRKNPCILSGHHPNGLRSYCVFSSRNKNSSSRLDGFIIEGGHSFLISPAFAAGVSLDNSSISLANLIIRDNLSQKNQALAIYNNSGNSSVYIANVEVCYNLPDTIHQIGTKGPIAIGDATVYFVNFLVHNNELNNDPIIHIRDSQVQFHNFTLADNPIYHPQLFYNYSIYIDNNSGVKFYNSILHDLTVIVPTGNPVYYNCLVEGSGGSGNWISNFGTDGGNNLDGTALFKKSNNYIPDACSIGVDDGSYFHLAGNLYDILDLDYDGITLEPVPIDIKGNPRIVDSLDMGAYEYQSHPGGIDTSHYYLCGMNDSIYVNGEFFSDTGSFFRKFYTIKGCDSLVQLIIERPVLDTSISVINNGSTAWAHAQNSNFRWMDCNSGQIVFGARDSVFAGLGSFAVIVYKNGCSDTSRCVQIDNLGFSDLDSDNLISMYPNPVVDQLHFNLKNGSSAYIVMVHDPSGRLVLQESLIGEYAYSINMGSIPSGVYFLTINGKNVSAKTQILKR